MNQFYFWSSGTYKFFKDSPSWFSKLSVRCMKQLNRKFICVLNRFTGLAKPAPVIETFCSDELVSRHVKLDGVVTLVDCKHAMKHLNEVKPRFVVNDAVEQVAYADRIILNKVSFCL